MSVTNKACAFALSLLISAIAGVAHAQAPANDAVVRAFEASFLRGYQANYCRQNIENFVRRANEAGLDLSRANIIELTNKGGSVFGMLNAEHARNQGRLLPKPIDGMRLGPGETNWDYHVILELDGKIYDFDYGNTPQVVGVRSYIKKMFLDELPAEQGGRFFSAPAAKLDGYELKFTRVVDFLRRTPQPNRTTLTLREFSARFSADSCETLF